jgi:hypothetical protein
MCNHLVAEVSRNFFPSAPELVCCGCIYVGFEYMLDIKSNIIIICEHWIGSNICSSVLDIKPNFIVIYEHCIIYICSNVLDIKSNFVIIYEGWISSNMWSIKSNFISVYFINALE